MIRAALSLACFAVACGGNAPPAEGPTTNAAPPTTGPVLGPPMKPAEAPPPTSQARRGELMAPETFPPAKPSELSLSTRLPGTIEAALRERFAAAEAQAERGEEAAADKAFASLPKTASLSPWVTLARLRLRARREEWPTSVGAGAGDKRVTQAISTLEKLELGAVPEATRGPFVHERGRWQLVAGDYESARKALEEAVVTLPDEPEVLSLLGLSRLASGQVAEALEPIERATELDLGSAERWGNLGTIRMMNGKVNEAARAYRARLRLAPEDAQAHADLGIALVQIGELTQGRTELTRATELEPSRASFLSNLAYAQHRSGLRAEAKQTYARALGRDAKSLVALLGLSAVLSENPAELGEARKLFERAERIAPDDPRVIAAKNDLLQLEKKPH